MKKNVLIVDDDISFLITLKTFLGRHGYDTDEASSAERALEKLSKSSFDVVLTDFRLPDQNGIELLKSIKEKNPSSLVILMTAYADIRMAVRAIKHGAYEYVAKPVNPDELLEHIKSGMEKMAEQSQSWKKENFNIKGVRPMEYLEAGSKEARAIHEYVDLVASTDMSVLIQGESGTGKEYIARKIHERSHRKEKPFIAVDCGALSRELAGSEFFGHIKGSFTGAVQDKTGQFEAANNGTLFLDEISNLSYEIQVKLLRAIQERQIRKIGSNNNIPVDVRIIAATNEELLMEVKKGKFREDLYHRLNEFSMIVPPLRERKEDIQLFVNYFLKQANQSLGKNVDVIPDPLMEVFLNYSWPGNIREIKNVVKRAVLLSKSKELDKNALPHEIIYSTIMQPTEVESGNDNFLKSQTGKTEKEIIIATLQKAKYNKSKVARLLNIDRRTLYNKLKLYGISLD